MPGQLSGQPSSIPGHTFASRQQAVAFLRKNPDFVLSRFGNLSEGSPKLLADAGYKVEVKWDGGEPRYDVKRNGKVIHTYAKNLPKAVAGVNKLKIQKPKPGAKPKTKPAGGGQGHGGPAMYGSPSDAGPAMDYSALAAAVGIDPRMFQGLNPNVGNLIPLGMANRGAQVMGQPQQDALVKSLIGDQYSRQESLAMQERSRSEAQNKMNLDNVRGWYDQVMKSQGVAAQRDEEFGQAAIQSAQGATEAIVSALGGAANPGSYVAAAAGQENVGNIAATSAIENEYNADMAPLLQAESAGALAREQAAGSSRNRDLTMRMAELQTNRSSAEADLRFKLWQSNNEVLANRLQNELAIRQANTGLRQQQFQNQTGLRQMMLAAQAGAAGNVVDVAQVAQRDASDRAGLQADAAKEANRNMLEQAKEAGRNYRAQLSAAGRKKQATYATADEEVRDLAYSDILTLIEGRDLDPKQAQKVAIAVVQGYGWSAQNAAVQALLVEALREAGY